MSFSLACFRRLLDYFSSVWFGIIFHFDKAGFKVIFVFVLAERPKYTFDFSEEEEDDADDDDTFLAEDEEDEDDDVTDILGGGIGEDDEN